MKAKLKLMWEEEIVAHFKTVILPNNSTKRTEEHKGKPKLTLQVP
jgi:hypothetical protein